MIATRRTAGLLFASLVLALSSTPLTPSVRAVGATTWVVAHRDEIENYAEGSTCAAPDFWTDGGWSEAGSGAGDYDSDEDAIQDAIDNASSGDTIYVCFGRYEFDTDLHNIDPGMNLTIVGDGIGATVFDGTDSTRLINSNPVGEVDDGGTLTLQDLSMEDAHTVDPSHNGGAVNADGLTLVRVSISGSDGAYNGGALYAEGDVQIRDSEINGNSSSRDGAALYAWNAAATVQISDSLFEANESDGFAGAVTGGGDMSIRNADFIANESGRFGGAVVNTGSGADVFIEGSNFSGNLSDEIGAALVMQNLASLEIAKSTFEDNIAQHFGGAINLSNIVEVTIKSSAFYGNEALGMGDDDNGNGGAIDACDVGSFTSIGSRYVGNVSTKFGGAIGLFGDSCSSPGSITLTRNLFSGNSATSHGGALWLSGELDSMVGNRFVGNSAGGLGGAVFGGWWAGGELRSQRIQRNLFKGNEAFEGGGALWLPGQIESLTRNTFRANQTDGWGGAIALSGLNRTGWRAIRGNQLLRNRAEGRGGAFYLQCSSLSRSSLQRLSSTNRLSGNVAGESRRYSRTYQAGIC